MQKIIKALRRTLIAGALLLVPGGMKAQDQVVEGLSYYLPKTALRFTLLTEKTSFTPGELADYANKYFMKGDEVLTPTQTYRIISIKMEPIGIPDADKHFTANASPKWSIQKVYTTTDGILLAVNTEPAAVKEPDKFVPAPKPAPLNPRNYMSQEILSVGSKAKLAQYCAKEVYDIRDARNELTRGQAETMPKDGAQLKLMMASMDEQETALTSLFNGTTVKDTMENTIIFCDTAEVSKCVLFRFSDIYGLCNADDLAGEPYYISIKDLHQTPEDTRTEKEIARQKDETGLHINVPGRAKVTVFQGNTSLVERDIQYAQFGRTENISPTLFNKKVFTSYEVNPITGNMTNLQSK